MELGFRDEITNKVDGKGRVSIPAAFRTVLAAGDPDCDSGKNPRMVLMHGMGGDPCLKGYTIEAAKKMERQILSLPEGIKRKKLYHRMAARTIPLSIDENGRVIIRKDLLEKFNIDATAIFVGHIELFQIWNPDEYVVHAAALDSDIDDEDIIEFLNDVPWEA